MDNGVEFLQENYRERLEALAMDYHSIEERDLDLFSVTEDLFSSHSGRTFNTIKLATNLDRTANRAKKVCDAQAQLMLAKMQSCPEQEIERKDKAQHIAFELGVLEYTGIETPSNPFEEEALQDAWHFGYTTAASQRKTQQHAEIERKFWEQGVDTENESSQFELAAVALYNIAITTTNPTRAERANRLAMEMCCYNDNNTPSAKRQDEINRFMALQSQRLAQLIEF